MFRKKNGTGIPSYIQRLKGLWYMLTSKNFILIYHIKDNISNEVEYRKLHILKRTNYDEMNDIITVKFAYFLLKDQWINKQKNKNP